MGRTGQHDRFAVVLPGKKQQGSAPHPAGAHLLFLLGRNGHDGSADASPDPLCFSFLGWSQWRDGSAVSFLQAANVALVRLT